MKKILNLTNEASSLNKILHFSNLDNVIYGEYNSYLFSLYITKPGHMTLFIEIDNVPSMESVNEASTKYNKKIYLKTLANSYACYVDMNYNLEDSDLREKILKELDDVTNLLRETSTMQKNKCMFCGKRCDTSHLVKGFNIYIHDDCWKQQRIESQARMKKWDKMKKRYPLAILVAFLFALFGLVPSVLLAGFAKVQLGALYILGPLGAFLGYKVCHTIIGYPRKFAIGLTSGLASIVMYMLTCLWMSKNVNPQISFVDALNANIGFFMQIILFTVMSVLLVNIFVVKIKAFRNEEEEFYSNWM